MGEKKSFQKASSTEWSYYIPAEMKAARMTMMEMNEVDIKSPMNKTGHKTQSAWNWREVIFRKRRLALAEGRDPDQCHSRHSLGAVA